MAVSDFLRGHFAGHLSKRNTENECSASLLDAPSTTGAKQQRLYTLRYPPAYMSSIKWAYFLYTSRLFILDVGVMQSSPGAHTS